MGNTIYSFPDSEVYSRLQELDSLKRLDENSLGYYYLVIMSATSVEKGVETLTKLHQYACKEGLCGRGYSGEPIAYRSMLHDIRQTTKKAGVTKSPRELLKDILGEYAKTYPRIRK